jgi:FkbM family methyltransferase
MIYIFFKVIIYSPFVNDLKFTKVFIVMSILNTYIEIYNQEIKGYQDYILNRVLKTNTLWEEMICNIIVDNMRNDTEFVDIGANIGLITLGVNKIANETGKLIKCFHAFECDSDTFHCLKSNIKSIENNVKIYPFALADKNQLCLMSINNYNRGCNFIYNTQTNENTATYNYPFIPTSNYNDKMSYIPSIPLDDINYQFSDIGVIKIDVEGFEYFVLLGAKQTILKYKPVIIIEIWDVNKDSIFELFDNFFMYKITHINEQNYICVPLLNEK